MTAIKKLTGGRSAIALIALVVLIIGCEKAYAYQTQHVVVVLIDGVRYTEGLGSAYCPRLNALASQAAIQDSAFNDSITVTASAVPATWMGRWYALQDTTYQGNNIQFCRYPTFWEYARKDLAISASQAIYVTPDYGNSTWRPSFYPGYGPNYWPQFVQPQSTVGDNNIPCFDSAAVVLKRQHPKLMYVYLPDTDHAGHSGVWADYIAKIREADSLCKALWDTIQSDTALANKTAMIITNDHGRHTASFSGHGDGCFGCRHVMMFAIGPDFKQNFHANTPRARITDITKTAGALLGFNSPQSPGRVLTELITSCTAPVATSPHDTTLFKCNLAQISLHGFSATDSENNLDTVYAIGGVFRGDSVTFTPIIGLNTIKLIAVDTCGLADTAITRVTVNLNHAPVVTSPNDTTRAVCNMNQICLPGFRAADADNNLTSLTAVGGILHGDTICFAPVVGVNTLKLIAGDACGLADTGTAEVIVNLNRPPVAVSPNDTTMFACNLNQICLPGFVATDPDNNLATYYAIGGTLHHDTVCFSPMAGQNMLKFIAVDNCGVTDTSITIVTVNLNHPPVAISPTDTTIADTALLPTCLPGFSVSDQDNNLDTAYILGGDLHGDTVCFTPVLGGNVLKLIAIDLCGAADTGTTVITIPGGASCTYVPGDINGDGGAQGGDVTYGVRFLKLIGSQPHDSCFIDSLNAYLYVAGDVNGNCEFRGSDISRLVAYFKLLANLSYCHWAPPGGPSPLIKPEKAHLESIRNR